MFLTAHANQVLKTITLVGEINNTEFKNFLRKSSFSLEYDFLKSEYAP